MSTHHNFEALWDLSTPPGHPLLDLCDECCVERRYHRVDPPGNHEFQQSADRTHVGG